MIQYEWIDTPPEWAGKKVMETDRQVVYWLHCLHDDEGWVLCQLFPESHRGLFWREL